MTATFVEASPAARAQDCGAAAPFLESEAHGEVLARMRYLVDERMRLGLALGPPGSGKTTLLAKFRQDLQTQGATAVYVRLLGLGLPEALLATAVGLHVSPSRDASCAELWRRIADRLAEHRHQRTSAVLLFDDADAAAEDVLLGLARLLELEPSPEARLTVVLAADSSRAVRLGRRILDRVGLRMDIDPWQRDDVQRWIQTALARDCRQRNLSQPDCSFTPDAVETVVQRSGGNPRRVVQLVGWALVAAAGLELAEIDDETVAAAAEELGPPA